MQAIYTRKYHDIFISKFYRSVEPSPYVQSLSDLWDFRGVSSQAEAKFEKFKEHHTFKFVMTEDEEVCSKQ